MVLEGLLVGWWFRVPLVSLGENMERVACFSWRLKGVFPNSRFHIQQSGLFFVLLDGFKLNNGNLWTSMGSFRPVSNHPSKSLATRRSRPWLGGPSPLLPGAVWELRLPWGPQRRLPWGGRMLGGQKNRGSLKDFWSILWHPQTTVVWFQNARSPPTETSIFKRKPTSNHRNAPKTVFWKEHHFCLKRNPCFCIRTTSWSPVSAWVLRRLLGASVPRGSQWTRPHEARSSWFGRRSTASGRLWSLVLSDPSRYSIVLVWWRRWGHVWVLSCFIIFAWMSRRCRNIGDIAECVVAPWNEGYWNNLMSRLTS